MCGIFGYNWVDKALARRMDKALAHRGPDDHYSFSDINMTLGHRRLAIIDVSKKARQPMCNEDGTVWIVFNGEIYNYKEIRSGLKAKGHVFKSHSDTEVIIHAYEEYGSECIKMFNGMWAFCIYDKNKGKLFFGRDRLGIKPLYYSLKGNRIIFASEIKAIIEHVQPEACKQAIVDYLTFQNIFDDKTFFSGIKMLMPGHSMTYDLKSGKSRIIRYWSPSFRKRSFKSVEECTRGFRKVLEESVKRHMISDVPVGSYLSGGFDSASVAKLASQHSDGPLSTFTGRFKEGGHYDETSCSREIAQSMHAKRYEVTITPKDFVKSINSIVYHMDEPRASIAAIPSYHVSKLVSKHLKVVLTGHGGDELFAGYPVFKSAYFKELVRKNPLNALRLNYFKASELPRALYFLIYPIFDQNTRYGHVILHGKSRTKSLLHKTFYESVMEYDQMVNLKRLYDPNLGPSDNIHRIYELSFLHALLLVEDKLGMAHSIEARTPLLDNEMVEFANSVPQEYKLYKNQLKYLLKESMKTDLPSSLYKQPKRGFPTPLSLWFRKELKGYLYDTLLSERAINRGVFNAVEVKKLLDEHSRRKTDNLLDLVNANRIWTILNVELWFRIFIDGEVVCND